MRVRRIEMGGLWATLTSASSVLAVMSSHIILGMFHYSFLKNYRQSILRDSSSLGNPRSDVGVSLLFHAANAANVGVVAVVGGCGLAFSLEGALFLSVASPHPFCAQGVEVMKSTCLWAVQSVGGIRHSRFPSHSVLLGARAEGRVGRRGHGPRGRNGNGPTQPIRGGETGSGTKTPPLSCAKPEGRKERKDKAAWRRLGGRARGRAIVGRSTRSMLYKGHLQISNENKDQRLVDISQGRDKSPFYHLHSRISHL